MKAAAFHTFGPPDVLELLDVPTPRPGPGEVRVRVKAAGVQPTDAAIRSGWSPPGITVTFPQVVGNEFAGVVDEVGADVTGLAAGDEVLGFHTLGCAAEYVVVRPDEVVRKPAKMPWEQAGALSASGQTAHTALSELEVREGETVLVHGAAGGVGSMATQIALFWGATVVGTAAPEHHEYLHALGAHPVSYGDGLVERVRAVAPQGVDAAFDTAGHGNIRTSLELVADVDRIGTVADWRLADELGMRFLRSSRSVARLAHLVEMHHQGHLNVHVRQTFSLADAAQAHRLVETGHGRGKVVLLVD